MRAGVLCNKSQSEPLSVPQAVAIRGKQLGAERNRVALVPGYFNESLRAAALARAARPALYVDVNVDLYLSAKQALAFLAENRLLVPGTLVAYDDFFDTAWLVDGETQAHAEIAAEYKVSRVEIAAEHKVTVRPPSESQCRPDTSSSWVTVGPPALFVGSPSAGSGPLPRRRRAPPSEGPGGAGRTL